MSRKSLYIVESCRWETKAPTISRVDIERETAKMFYYRRPPIQSYVERVRKADLGRRRGSFSPIVFDSYIRARLYVVQLCEQRAASARNTLKEANESLRYVQKLYGDSSHLEKLLQSAREL